jgi:hypothetical protein
MTHESIQLLFVMITCSFSKCEKKIEGKGNDLLGELKSLSLV